MTSPGREPAPPDAPPILDWRRVRAALPQGFDLREPAAILIQECARWMGELRDDPSGETAERALHSMKGSARVFGAGPVARIAANLEARARAGDLEVVQRELPALASELERLVAALRAGPPPGTP